ncbi:MAG: NfeD family protein [Caldisericum sp.]|uniref:NfeD family protein n=1 Tax=unclassified Caldisericum TaxID=2641600 RepID=UPI0039FD2B2A
MSKLNLTIFWIIVAALSAIIEINTLTFFSIWFSVAAIISLIFNLLDFGITAQIVVFIASSLALILSSEFLLKKKLKIIGYNYKTNIDMIIGKIGVVTKDVKDISYSGEVLVEGRYWTAISEDGSVIEKGKKVVVTGVEGVKLIVKEAK